MGSLKKRRRRRPPTTKTRLPCRDQVGSSNINHVPTLGSKGAIPVPPVDVAKEFQLIVDMSPRSGVSSGPSQGHRSCQGFLPPPFLAQALLRCMMRADIEMSGSIGGDYMQIAQTYFSTNEDFHMASLAVRATQLNMDPQPLQCKLWRLMSAHWQYGLVRRLAVERQPAKCQSQDSLISHIDYNNFDETPMKANIKGDSEVLSHKCGESIAKVAAEDAKAVVGMEGFLWSRHMPLKLLQCKQKFGVVIQHDSAENGYLRLKADFPTPLQACQNTTGEVDTIIATAVLVELARLQSTSRSE